MVPHSASRRCERVSQDEQAEAHLLAGSVVALERNGYTSDRGTRCDAPRSKRKSSTREQANKVRVDKDLLKAVSELVQR